MASPSPPHPCPSTGQDKYIISGIAARPHELLFYHGASLPSAGATFDQEVSVSTFVAHSSADWTLDHWAMPACASAEGVLLRGGSI